MSKQANILAFDDVRRSRGARRPSSAAPKSASNRRSPASSRRSGAPAGRGDSAYASSSASRISGGLYSGESFGRSSGSGARSASSRAAFTPTFVGQPDRKNTAPRNARGSATRANAAAFVEEEREEEQIPEKRSRREEKRRNRQKKAADKKFEKQFGGSRAPSDASSGPRAAVYKGEMGATHKRSARMQNEASGSSTPSAKRGFSLSFASMKSSPKFMAGAVVMVCLVLACWFLYTPAQQLYQSVREHDRLQAEYAAIEERNQALQSEVDYLGTSSGVEDRALQQFGWVKEGYETAKVKGLSSTQEENSNFKANIVPGSVEAPETWYSPFLDALFGVS